MTDRPPEQLRLDRIATPIGDAAIVTDETGCVRAFDWHDRADGMMRLLRLHYGTLALRPGAAPAGVRRAFADYFEGGFAGLATIRWRTGGTAFQRAVWAALTMIEVGQTRSYGALAVQLGCPKATRAVGTANGSNPISVLVPCHRVIGSSGSLTGYGGGIERKRWLLRHEGALDRDTRRGAKDALHLVQ